MVLRQRKVKPAGTRCFPVFTSELVLDTEIPSDSQLDSLSSSELVYCGVGLFSKKFWLSQQNFGQRHLAPHGSKGILELSKFDEARKNSAAVNPNRPQERIWEPSMQTVDGIITVLAGTTMTMKNRDEKLVSHTLVDDATYTCDGVVCQASDLAIGHRVRVTVAKADRSMAVGIESLSKDKSFKSLLG